MALDFVRVGWGRLLRVRHGPGSCHKHFSEGGDSPLYVRTGSENRSKINGAPAVPSHWIWVRGIALTRCDAAAW